MKYSFTMTPRSFDSRRTNPFSGLVVGPIFVIAAIALLWWNEGRAIRAIAGLDQAASHVTEAQASGPSPADDSKLVHVVGTATAQAPIQDQEVGITFTGQVSVARTAEMYQWKESKETRQGGETSYYYSRDWSAHPIDSSDFTSPGGHENPEMPFRSTRWSADDAKLGGWKLGTTTLDRIAFSEVLKPDAPTGWGRSGNDYYRGDPTAPQIGDMRARYSGLPSGTTISVLAQQSGDGFVVFTTANGYEVLVAAIGNHSAAELIERQRKFEALKTWALRGLGTLVMFVGFAAFLAPLSTMATLVPMLGAFLRGAIVLVSLAIALLLSILVIGLAWLAYRPLIAVGLILVAVAAGYGLWRWREKRRPELSGESAPELSADRDQIAPMVRTIDIAPPASFGGRFERVEAYGRTKGEIENRVREFARSLAGNETTTGRSFWRRLLLPAEIVSARAPLKGKLAFYGGGTLVVLGFVLFTAVSFALAGDNAHTWPFWAALAGSFALSIAGGSLRNRGKRLLQPTASEVRARDFRRPIVLLRSFPDDALTVVTGRSKEGLETGDFEEGIADQFSPFGPFVGIGKPGEALPTLGAARNYYSDAEWQDAVRKWMDEALVIVVIAGVTAGLRWELETIRSSGHLDKLLVLMPPLTLEGGGSFYFRWSGAWMTPAKERAESETRWDTIRAAFAGIDAFDDLPDDRPTGLIAMHIGQDGKLVLLAGPEIAWEQDFETAIRYALYGMYIHGPRSVSPQTPNKSLAGTGLEASSL